jgi:hypothetical protein
MFAVVEHNFQDVVVIVYCRFFAKAKKKVFQIEIFMGFEFCFAVEGCTRILTSLRLYVTPSHMSRRRLSWKMDGVKRPSRPMAMIRESPLPWREKTQSPRFSLACDIWLFADLQRTKSNNVATN